MRSRQTVILRMQKCGPTPTLYRCFEEVGGGVRGALGVRIAKIWVT